MILNGTGSRGVKIFYGNINSNLSHSGQPEMTMT